MPFWYTIRLPQHCPAAVRAFQNILPIRSGIAMAHCPGHRSFPSHPLRVGRRDQGRNAVLGVHALARRTPVVFAPDVPALDTRVNRKGLVLGLKGQAEDGNFMALAPWGCFGKRLAVYRTSCPGSV